MHPTTKVHQSRARLEIIDNGTIAILHNLTLTTYLAIKYISFHNSTKLLWLPSEDNVAIKQPQSACISKGHLAGNNLQHVVAVVVFVSGRPQGLSADLIRLIMTQPQYPRERGQSVRMERYISPSATPPTPATVFLTRLNIQQHLTRRQHSTPTKLGKKLTIAPTCFNFLSLGQGPIGCL